MKLLPCFALLVLYCSLAMATPPAGTIERVTKQQILASIPPNGHEPVLFLTSPSGKYAAYFVRTHTVPGAGGLGANFCYVQVVDTSTAAHGHAAGLDAGGKSVWESECRPISTVNTCALLFSWDGLEVFDGSEEVWHGETNRDGTNFLETLELVDDGDMRIREKDGELAWRASDEPWRCGAPGSPGLGTAATCLSALSLKATATQLSCRPLETCHRQRTSETEKLQPLVVPRSPLGSGRVTTTMQQWAALRVSAISLWWTTVLLIARPGWTAAGPALPQLALLCASLFSMAPWILGL